MNGAAAEHLPHFFCCSQCSGYYQKNTEKPFYSDDYFILSSQSSKKSVFQPIFDLLLFLRRKKIQKFFPRNGACILDYGCGNGKFVSYLKRKGFNIEGFDPSLSAVALSQKNNLPVFDKIPNKQYDLIMFWHSLEHSDMPLNDLKKCKQYLLPGAKLLIAVPNGESLEAKISGRRWFCYDWPFHRVHFTPKSIQMLLEKTGFKIISIDYFNPEYTASSLAQTFLNLFLPYNALYSAVANRRVSNNRFKILVLSALSFLMLIIFSPLLLLFFLIQLLMKRTAAFIVVAEKLKNNYNNV